MGDNNVFIASTFSLNMLSKGVSFFGEPCHLADIPAGVVSIIRSKLHSIALPVILQRQVEECDEKDIKLVYGDVLYCVLINFPNKDTWKESIKKSTLTCYKITILPGDNVTPQNGVSFLGYNVIPPERVS